MEDLYNKVLSFVPNKELKDHKLSPGLFTELIERDFPLTISKDPRERYLGLKKMDLISKGHMYLSVVEYLLSNSVGRRKFITDAGVQRMMRKESFSINWNDNIFTAYHYTQELNIQLYLDLLHGKIEDTPSILISENSYVELPFSLDLYIMMTLSFRKITALFGQTDTLDDDLQVFVSSYQNEEDLCDAIKSGIEIPKGGYMSEVAVKLTKRFENNDKLVTEAVAYLTKKL